FEVFTQADKSTTRKYGGSGLGLAITKRLLELMESEITVESEEGKGAIFFFKLTLKRTRTAVKKVVTSVTQDLPLLSGDILLVEDNPFNRAIAKDFLTSWGCRVSEAINGREALEHLADKKTDLVLLDLQMPVMDGYETIKALRENEDPYYQKLPVIALTASAFGETREKVYKAGMNDFVTKPFHPKEFYSKLANYLILSQEPIKDENIDAFIISNLKEKLGEDDDQIQKYLGIFTSMLVEECERLNESISTKNQDELRVYAHKNKSSLKLVGLDEMAKEAEELEDMIDHKNPSDMILTRAISHSERIAELLDQLQLNE
ncbi:MAG: response regulator, partial [Bacteroidota bacterium]